MKKIYILLFALFLLNNVNAQWQSKHLIKQTDTPNESGGGVMSFAVINSNIFAGTFGAGIFLSTNNGSSWTAINNNLPFNLVVTSLATSGNNLFAGTNWGMYLSTDTGSSWTAISNGLTYDGTNTIQSIAISGNNIFAGSEANGVYLSTNNGSSWTVINSGQPNYTYVSSLAISGSNIFAATDKGVYLSTDTGSSWTAVSNGLIFDVTNTIQSIAISDSNIFVGTMIGGIYLSTNNGSSWTAVNDGFPIDSSGNNPVVYSLAIIGNNLFAGTDSTIGGWIWERPLSEMIGLNSIDTIYSQIILYQEIKDSIFLSVIDSCLFDYTQPIDTFYIASAQINNSQMQCNWVFKQGVNTYNVVSDIDVDKVSNGYNLIYLTIQCNESKKKGLQTNTFVAPYNITLVSVQNVTQSPLDVTIYPNPTTDKITFSLNGNSAEKPIISIFNVAGQKIMYEQFNGQNKIEMDVSTLAKGIYFMKIQSNAGIVSKKLVIQ